MEIQLPTPRCGEKLPAGYERQVSAPEDNSVSTYSNKFNTVFQKPIDIQIVQYLNAHPMEPRVAKTFLLMLNQRFPVCSFYITTGSGGLFYRTQFSEYGHFEKTQFLDVSRISIGVLNAARRHFCDFIDILEHAPD